VSFFTSRPRASQLRQWHIETRTAIDDRELTVLNLIAERLPVPDAVLGMTEEEVADYFEDARRELDTAASLLALAEAEAVLRVDFLSRVQMKAKDPVSRSFRDLYQDKEGKVRLDEDLLGTWTNHYPQCKAAVSEFRAALNLRNWLAHGRYWTPKLGRTYATQDVFGIAERLFNALPGVDGWT
jgi:hypothetical protein